MKNAGEIIILYEDQDLAARKEALMLLAARAYHFDAEPMST